MLSPDDLALLRRLPGTSANIPMHRPSVPADVLRDLARIEDLRYRGLVRVTRTFPGDRKFNVAVALTSAGAVAVGEAGRAA
nr:hypothetical protein [uncultured Rhodopila sp.]